MRGCCEEYVLILALLDSLKAETPAATHERLDQVKSFVQAEYRRHVDEAGEASYEGD
jgi:hypothetical protein